jgi:hypothetical protein
VLIICCDKEIFGWNGLRNEMSCELKCSVNQDDCFEMDSMEKVEQGRAQNIFLYSSEQSKFCLSTSDVITREKKCSI